MRIKFIENNIFKYLFTSLLIYFFLFKNVFGAIIYPQRYGSEGRFKSLLYHTNGVYYYEGYYMFPTYIEFGDKEKINTIYLQKPDTWAIKYTGNRIFLTPVADDADTTMTVMTNLRKYFFELHARYATGPFDKDVSFFVKFRYPSGSDGKNSDLNAGSDSSITQYVVNKGPDLSKPENFNFNYTVSGDYLITPIKIFDDGRYTYFEFRDKGGVMPAFFSVDNDGFESPVNFKIIHQYLAVEGIFSVFTLRHGTETVCVFNETLRGLSRNMTQKK